jgi:hypothetical protein
MIVSASYRTDIPAFYGPWFMNRLKAGYCKTVNPYGRQVHTVPLNRHAVDAFVFWTRNLGPFLDSLVEVGRRGFPFVVQYTVTGYPRALDYATIEPERAVAHLKKVARSFGRRAGVWRYDPVVFSSLTPPERHEAAFACLAAELAGTVDEVVVSFAQVYRKTARNMAAAARAFHFDWRDPPEDEKRALLGRLAGIAAGHGLALTLCGQPELLVPGVAPASCIDARRLGEIAGRPIRARHKPHRETCLCWQSRDIGEYDTCPHGCVYCYAVQGRTLAKARFRAHDPESPFLFPPPAGTETGEPPARRHQGRLL